jgi:hydrogenase expression/formation protein HypC
VAVPARVVGRDGSLGSVELGGLVWEVYFDLLPDAGPGELVLVHAGYALERISEAEAAELEALLREVLEWENGP